MLRYEVVPLLRFHPRSSILRSATLPCPRLFSLLAPHDGGGIRAGESALALGGTRESDVRDDPAEMKARFEEAALLAQV